jgi:hypothetical protein
VTRANGISRGLHIIAEGRSLGRPIESDARNFIGLPPRNLKGRLQYDRRDPARTLFVFMRHGRRVELDIVRKIGEEDLTGGKEQHISDVRAIDRCIRRPLNRRQVVPVPFKEYRRRISKAGLAWTKTLSLGSHDAGPCATLMSETPCTTGNGGPAVHSPVCES